MSRPFYWIALGILLLLAGAVVLPSAVCTVCWTIGRHRHNFERPASTTLKTIASAQADFRANDRDGDGVHQFWRADIAGLYALAPGGGPAIKLIELSVAAADERARIDFSAYAVPSTKAGYWYRAIRHADEDPKKLDPDRFAVCAFPDSPTAGKYLFILDENNTIYRTVANGRRGIEVFPSENELKTSWAKLD